MHWAGVGDKESDITLIRACVSLDGLTCSKLFPKATTVDTSKRSMTIGAGWTEGFLRLSDGQVYYALLEVFNGAGASTRHASPPFIVDTTAPLGGLVVDVLSMDDMLHGNVTHNQTFSGPAEGVDFAQVEGATKTALQSAARLLSVAEDDTIYGLVDATYTSNSTCLFVSFGGFYDPHSPIVSYSYALCSAADECGDDAFLDLHSDAPVQTVPYCTSLRSGVWYVEGARRVWALFAADALLYVLMSPSGTRLRFARSTQRACTERHLPTASWWTTQSPWRAACSVALLTSTT